MCNDLNEYNPFEPNYYLDYDGSLELDSYPMTVDDWDNWLEID